MDDQRALAKSTTPTGTVKSERAGQCVATNWSHLVSERVEIDFEYTIYNFDFWRYDRSSMEYSTDITFSAKAIPDSHWKLSVINKGSNESLIIKLHLFKDSDKKNSEQKLSSPVKVELAILNKKREKKYPEQYFFSSQAPTPLSLSFLNFKYHEKELADLLPDGKLTIHCKIESLTKRRTAGGHIIHESADDDWSINYFQLITQFAGLFETKKLSDVIFQVRGFTFQSHKCVLGARSPVFAAMFEHETEEKLTDKVEIQDIEPEVFHEVLRFVYTGQVCPKRLQKFGTKLLAAADKYLLENLKQLCEKHLVNTLNPENCLEMLSFTDLHSLDYLRERTFDFLRHHLTEVRKTNSWKEMKQKSPLWLCEVQEMILDLPTILRSVV